MDKLYQAMKAAAKNRKIKASPQHDLYKKSDPYFFSVFYYEDFQNTAEGKINIGLELSLKYHRYDEMQYNIFHPNKTMKFTDKARANSADNCNAVIEKITQEFEFNGSDEALPKLCDDILDFLEQYYSDFLNKVKNEYGDLGDYFIARKKENPRLAGLSYLDKGDNKSAAECFSDPAVDGENFIWVVYINTEEQQRRAEASGADIFDYNGEKSFERNQKQQLADFAAALKNAIEWTEDMAKFGLLPEEREGRGDEQNAKITSLDGSIEEQISALKDFLGLSPEQSFKDLDDD